MITRSEQSIRLTDPRRHKYADAMAEYLSDLAMDGGQDQDSGDVECPTGWFARFGRRILVGDERGFVWVEVWPEPLAAEQVYNAMQRYYDEWSYDEWCDGNEAERTEEEQAAILADCNRFMSYVAECAHENLESYDFEGWVARERPEGPLG